jgi:hypothetical protein
VAESVTELEQATTLVANPDPTDIFILGVVYQQARRFSDAVTAFERCSNIVWSWQERCKESAKEAKKQAAQAPAKQP